MDDVNTSLEYFCIACANFDEPADSGPCKKCSILWINGTENNWKADKVDISNDHSNEEIPSLIKMMEDIDNETNTDV